MTETTATAATKNGKPWLIGIGIAVVIGLLAWWGVASWVNGVENVGETKQNDLLKLRDKVENDLSTCLDQGAVAAQVAQQEYASVKDVLVSTAAARYKDTGSALGQGGAMFSILSEQNPQIDQSTWKRLMGIIVGCRGDVRDSQERLQNTVGDFKSWTTTGGLLETGIRNNFPTDALVVIDPLTGDKAVGKDALDVLDHVISTKDAKEAMSSGTMPEQQMFPSTTPSK